MQSVLFVALVFAHSLDATYSSSYKNEGLLKIGDAVRPSHYPVEVKEGNIQPSHILRKRSGLTELTDDCLANITYETIYKVRGKEGGLWRTVIHDQNVSQKIRLEVCMSSGSPCFLPFVQTPGYRTSCVQSYTELEMRVISLDGNGTELIKAQLPVACSCKYQSVA